MGTRSRICIVGILALSVLFSNITPASAEPSAIRITPANEEPVRTPGETFFDQSFRVRDGGGLVLSGSEDGDAQFYVDDAIDVTVTHADGTVRTFSHDFSNGCGGIVEAGPFNLSGLLGPGENTVRVVFRDICGVVQGSSAIWMIAEFGQTSHRSPDFKFVQYVREINFQRCLRELVRGLPARISLDEKIFACAALDQSDNPNPPRSFSRRSWNAFKRSMQYRSLFHIPAVQVDCLAGEIKNYHVARGFEKSLGFTRAVNRFFAAERYRDTGSSLFNRSRPSVAVHLDRRSLTVTYRLASRISTPERFAGHQLLGYDAPFIWSVFRQTISCDGGYRTEITQTDFPSVSIYVDDRRVVSRTQTDALADFIKSGGTRLNRPGKGNLRLVCRSESFSPTDPTPRLGGTVRGEACLDAIYGNIT